MGMPYIGWTEAGEWVRITVVVHESGIYDMNLIYACADNDGKISIAFDDNEKWERQTPTTKSYHFWNNEKLASFALQEGVSVITFKMETGGLNMAAMEFTLQNE